METAKVQEQDKETIREEASKIIKNHVMGSMGVGLIPVPLVDLVALTGVQLNMLRKLSNLYDISFSKEKVKNLLGSLLGSAIPISVSGTVASLVKAIPVVGHTSAALVMPATSGATTYAVGKVFVQHFESGGTFLNFNPDEVKEYYTELYKEGQKVAGNMKKESPKKEEGKK
ncbi:MAG: YcjF family protein [Thermodesulfobacteriota bacterium]|nr:YcjF family protein [Thermodesulfobacteriota bacterium]